MRTRSSSVSKSLALLATVACGGGDSTNPASVASVIVTAPDSTVRVGLDLQMRAIIRDGRGANVNGLPVTWSSSNDSIASVTQLGLVNGRAEGIAFITASAGGKSGSAAVTVAFPFANLGGVWNVTGAFDTPAGVANTFFGANNFIQQSRQSAGFSGSASLIISDHFGTLAGTVRNATLTEDGTIAFTVDNSSGTSWVFTGTVSGTHMSGRQTLTRPASGGGTETFSGPWSATR